MRPALTDAEWASRLSDMDAILSEAEPWLVDAGLLIPSQTLDSSGRKSNLGEIKLALNAFLFSKEGFMSSMLCDRLDYCNFRKKHGKRFDLMKGTADALGTFLTGIPVPMIIIAAYLIEDEYIERLCNCTDKV